MVLVILKHMWKEFLLFSKQLLCFLDRCVIAVILNYRDNRLSMMNQLMILLRSRAHRTSLIFKHAVD
jgi:hypothetical protein